MSTPSNYNIATACAYRPEDRARAVENQLLNAFDATLRDLRRTYAYTPGDEVLPAPVLRARHRIRAREMNKAIARLAVRLAAAGVA